MAPEAIWRVVVDLLRLMRLLVEVSSYMFLPPRAWLFHCFERFASSLHISVEGLKNLMENEDRLSNSTVSVRVQGFSCSFLGLVTGC